MEFLVSLLLGFCSTPRIFLFLFLFFFPFLLHYIFLKNNNNNNKWKMCVICLGVRKEREKSRRRLSGTRISRGDVNRLKFERVRGQYGVVCGLLLLSVLQFFFFCIFFAYVCCCPRNWSGGGGSLNSEYHKWNTSQKTGKESRIVGENLDITLILGLEVIYVRNKGLWVRVEYINRKEKKRYLLLLVYIICIVCIYYIFLRPSNLYYKILRIKWYGIILVVVKKKNYISNS